MADFGIRISQEGVDVNTPLTETNKKDFVFLSDEGSPKVSYAGFVEADNEFSAITYTHNLGYVPLYFLFLVDSTSTPTYYAPVINTLASTTVITQYPGMYAYVMVLEEGGT